MWQFHLENPSCPLADVYISLALVSGDNEKVAMEMHLWEALVWTLEMLPPPQDTEAFHLLEEETPPPFPKQRSGNTLQASI